MKHSIEDMQTMARHRGGQCLSKHYVNFHTRLTWRCDKGHQWQAPPNSINSGCWCPICKKESVEKSKALYFTEVKKIAETRGGVCLSEHYTNSQTKLQWQCAKGHRWETRPIAIKGGSWCPHCAGRAKGSIEGMRKIAEGRGGKCLSDTYVNSYTKLLWECARGHQWLAAPGDVKRGNWCAHCSRNKGSIEEMQAMAEKHGGKCLSKEYTSSRKSLLWECAHGHRWTSLPASIKKGNWCRTCTQLNRLRVKYGLNPLDPPKQKRPQVSV